LTLLAWNCHHGTVSSRLDDVRELGTDVVFLQECRPHADDATLANVVSRRVGLRKGIAIGAVSDRFHVEPIALRRGCGKGVVAAAVTGPVCFTMIGLWARGPAYSKDVLRSIRSCRPIIRSGPTVILGDFNSGSKLGNGARVTKGHPPIVSALGDLGLVSAYHVFHQVDPGQEAHATYRHLFKPSQPWHIDFCFVPAAWADRIERVTILDTEQWTATSDHAPVQVTLRV
jgi:endonuclease/exonuclease/phosphatase family metal-dependent hydrolase